MHTPIQDSTTPCTDYTDCTVSSQSKSGNLPLSRTLGWIGQNWSPHYATNVMWLICKDINIWRIRQKASILNHCRQHLPWPYVGPINGLISLVQLISWVQLLSTISKKPILNQHQPWPYVGSVNFSLCSSFNIVCSVLTVHCTHGFKRPNSCCNIFSNSC